MSGRRLADLRRDFDSSFARPLRRAAAATDLLDIRVAGSAYAVRLAEVAALHADQVPTPLPDGPPHLLGVAGLGAALIAVYDLAALLGDPPSRECRWLVVTAAMPAVALAFEGLGGHLRIPPDAVAAGSPALVRTPAGTQPVIDLAAVHAAVATTRER